MCHLNLKCRMKVNKVLMKTLMKTKVKIVKIQIKVF